MLIIVEGPNGAGKSTLVDAIQKHLENNHPDDTTQVLHAKPPKRHPIDEYIRPLLGYRPGSGQNIICDRWHWGERVYPDLFNRSTQMDRGVWRYVEMFLRSRGAIVVYPYVSPATLSTRILERGDDMVDVTMTPREWASFNAVRFASALPVTMFSQLESHTSEQQIQAICATAQDHEMRTRSVEGLRTYVGPPRPDFLLVGDTRSRRGQDSGMECAFGPYPGSSGHFLLNALSGPRVVNTGLINANDVDDIEKAWKRLSRPPIVALGRKASHALAADTWEVGSGVPHSKVPHPQFIRRFYSKRQNEYGAIIDSAMATRKDLSKWRP
jgi:hypothetical protein